MNQEINEKEYSCYGGPVPAVDYDLLILIAGEICRLRLMLEQVSGGSSLLLCDKLKKKIDYFTKIYKDLEVNIGKSWMWWS